MPKKITLESFIAKANKIHNYKYDYSNVIYTKAITHVEIICPINGHGLFTQTPHSHVNGKQGCPSCGAKKLTKTQFIENANKIHNGKYDYSKSHYTNSITPVTIICNTHGEFKKTSKAHVNGKQGCPMCSFDNKKITSESFIAKANKIHNGKYDYSKSHYTNSITPVTIICNTHGEFTQTPNSHVDGKHGCPTCGGSKKLTKKQFIENANKIHNYTYDYSKSHYTTAITPVTIICNTHGEFTQTPHSHVDSKHGCPTCATESHHGSYNYKTISRKIDEEPQAKLNLYYIKLKNQDIWKVGLEKTKHSRWAKYKNKVEYIFSIELGMLEAFNLEQKLIEKQVNNDEIKEIFINELNKRGGYTEISSKPFFTDDELEYFKENKCLKDTSSLELFFAN